MSERSTKQIRELLDSLYRVDSGGILATRIRCLGDFDLAEEAMHEAFAAALCQKAHRVCKICKPITLCFQFLGPIPEPRIEPAGSAADQPSRLCRCPKCGGTLIIFQTVTAAQILLRSRLRSSVPHDTNFQKPQISIHLSARSALLRLLAELVAIEANAQTL